MAGTSAIRKWMARTTTKHCRGARAERARRRLGFSFVTPHSKFCESTSRTYFFRGLRVKETMPGSREVREGKKSAKGLPYTVGDKLEEAKPRIKCGATVGLEPANALGSKSCSSRQPFDAEPCKRKLPLYILFILCSSA